MQPTADHRSAAKVALLPVALAIWLHGAMWNGGLLGDDLLLRAYVVDIGANGATTAWHRVLEDAQGPWLFGSPFFYRPLVTLTFVLEQWLTGGLECVPHVTNLALHAACVFGVGRLAGSLFGAWAALCAGTAFASHPAVCEVICWPCARADLLAAVATVWACSALLRLRHRGGWLAGANLAAACVAAALAKESAVLLAPALLAFDFACARGVPWRQRLGVHLTLLPLWVAYLVWRQHLGVFPEVVQVWSAIDWARWPGLQCERLAHLFAPGNATWAQLAFAAWPAAAIWTACRVPAGRRWLVFGVAWFAITNTPASWQPVIPPNMTNSRSLLLPWAGLALALAGAANPALPRWWRWTLRVLLVAMIAGAATTTRSLQAGYETQWRRMHTLREQLATRGAAATDEAPLVALSFHLGQGGGLPFLDGERAYPLAIAPLASSPIPFVSLASVLGSEPALLQGDVTPWRVMWQHGATLAYWIGQGDGGELVTVNRRGASLPGFVAAADGFVPRAGPASPWPIGGFDVVAAAPFAGGRLVWHAATGHQGEVAVPASQAFGDRQRASVDVSADPGFVTLGTLRGIARVTVDLRGAGPVVASELVALAPPELAPLHTRLHGDTRTFAELATQLDWQSLPAHAEPGSEHVVLMNRSIGWRIARADLAAGRITSPVDGHLLQSRRIGREGCTYLYLCCRADGRAWRSEVDWFVARSR